MDDRCILCGAPLPPDRRWALFRLLNPRFPSCRDDLEACYRGLAARIKYDPSDEEVARVVARAKRGRG